MTADELRRLAVLIERTDHDAIDRAAAYLRACADALERGPVGWISPSNPRKDGSDPRQLVQDYEASGGYGFSADTALSRGWAALYPLAMPAPLQLPEPMTDEEVDALIDETLVLTERQRSIVSLALWNFINVAYAQATYYAQNGPVEHVSKFQDDARGAEEIRALLTKRGTA